MKIFDPKLTGSIEILNEITGDVTMSANLLVEGNLSGNITGSASTASYIELSNVDGSASLASRIFFNSSSIASLETVSGSYANSASFASNISANSSSIGSLNAVSSSYLLNTTDTLTGDLTVTGNIIATTLNVQDVTASVIYSSGSNVFGSSSIDTQQFTGSILTSGNIEVNGDKFTVAASSGNTVVGGTLNSGAITSTGNISGTNLTSTVRLFSGDGGNKTNPMIANSSDQDTGIFFPSANVMAFSAGNTEALRFTGANSTFSGEVTLSAETQYLNFKKASTADVLSTIVSEIDAGTGGKLRFLTKRNGDTQVNALILDDNQNATFSGTISSTSTSTNTLAGKLRINGTTTTGLEIASSPGSSSGLKIYNDSSNDHAYILNHYGGNLVLGTNNAPVITLNGTNSTFAGNVTGVGASFIGAAASGTALFTIENNSGSTATSYGLLVKGGGNSASGKTFEVRDDSGNTDLIVKGNGNVGIGTDDPDYTLHLLKSSGDTEMYINGQNGQSSLRMGLDARNWQIKTAAAPYLWSLNYVGTDVPLSNIITANVGGNVGIGTDSPDSLFNIESALANTAIITIGCLKNDSSWTVGDRIGGINFYGADGSGQGAGIKGSINYIVESSSGGSNGMTFNVAGTSNNMERMRIDSSGNVGIGTASPDNILHLETSAAGGPQIQLESTSGTANAAFINFDGTSLQFSTKRDMVDGTKYDSSKSWGGITISGASGGSSITFQTSPNSTDNPATRMQITTAGYSKFSNYATYQDLTGAYYEFNSNQVSANVNITNSHSGGSCLFLSSNSSNTSQYFIYGYGNSAEKFIIWTNGTFESAGNQRFGAGPAHGNSSSPGITTRANTTKGIYWNTDGSGGWGGGNFTTNNSDRNMKTNIVPMDINALKIIDSLETKYFNWTEKANRGDTSIRKAGIIAQDLKELMPEGVYGTEWKDDNKESNGLSLDENATTALLVKAIQELTARIKELENK